MKHVFFTLAFMLTGLFGAVHAIDGNLKPTFATSLSCENRVTVYTPCEETFYLCADNYGSSAELLSDVQYFTKAKCD